MRHVRFRDQSGNVKSGVWDENGIEFCGERYNVQDVEILPPIKPSKIIVTGFNYKDLIERLGVKIPQRPRLFFKTPNTIIAHGKVAIVPRGLSAVYEGELGVVIGKQCKNIKMEDARDYIAGFTCVNDMAIADHLEDDPGAVRKSGFDTATPVGPVMATKDLVPECPKMKIKVNGQTERSTDFSGQLFSAEEILAEITRYITLEPGDMFTTGTPIEPGAVSNGDMIEINIEGIGTLKHEVLVTK